jgi:polyhydroxyalkanoate synthesis regulator phasin
MSLEDVRKTIEATVGNLTPLRARQLAKEYLEPGAARDQVSKTAAELMDWSHRNRERLREFVAHEVARQVKTIGVAPQSDVDALKKRVRDLERAAGLTASGRAAAKRTTAARTSTKAKPSSGTATTRKPAASRSRTRAAEPGSTQAAG